MQPIRLRVNGQTRQVTVDPETPLLYVLNDNLNLRGPRFGCGLAQCGACTVIMDGAAVKSCTVLGVQADGSSVTTVEGLTPAEGLHPMQNAFWEQHGLQCGFCTPGMIMTAVDLLAHNPDPTDGEIRHALAGNYCRCTGYQNIVAAIRSAAQTKGAAAGAAPAETGVGAGAAG